MTQDKAALTPRLPGAAPPPSWARWIEPHRVFPLLALVYGLSLVFLTPPFQSPDEPAHFYRAYQISEGHFLPDYHRPVGEIAPGAAAGGAGAHFLAVEKDVGGGDLPDSLEIVARRFAHLQRPRGYKASSTLDANYQVSAAELADAWHLALDPQRRHFTRFVSAIYSPASYVPQAAAIFLARRLGFGPLALMYAGRVGNLVLWIFLSCLALRIAPTCRRPLLLLLLMPMTLFQAASLSADATTNALAVLFAAMVLRYVKLDTPAGSLAAASPRVGPGACAAFAVMAAMLALAKFVYLPLLALVLLIPPARAGGPRRYAVAITILVLLSLAAFTAWTSQTRGLDTVVMDKPGINPAEQLHFLRTHPSHLRTLITATVARDGSRIIRSFVGNLGWLDTPMSHLFTDAYLIAMFAACWLQVERSSFSRLLFILVAGAPVAISTLAIALLNYLYVIPVGENVAGGIQGRYLIPLAPAVILLLWGLAPRRLGRLWPDLSPQFNLGAAAVVSFSCVYTLVTVWLRYYA